MSGRINEMLRRYVLALATGTSLNLHRNCRAFLKALTTRWQLAYSSVWVKQQGYLTGMGDATGAAIVAANPPSGRLDRPLVAGHPLILRLRADEMFSIMSDHPNFAQIADDRPHQKGALAVYALGNVGVLKMYEAGRTHPFSTMELRGLNDVVARLTKSLADCMAYNRLQVSENKYRSLFEESRDAVFISTPEGRFIDINRAGAQMLGYEHEELLGIHIGRDIFADPAEWDRYKELMSRQGYVKDYETVLMRKDGRMVHAIETSGPVKGETGDIIAFRGIMRDVTEQRRLELQLQQAQKMESLGQLAGGIAHDFNNLLTGILAYTSLLQHRVTGDARSMRYLQTVEQSAGRAQELTSQLLGFARKGKYETRVVYLRDVVEETCAMLDRLLEANIIMELELGDDLPTVDVDIAQMEQVVMNLSINARDAMPNGGRIHIRTRLVSSAEVLTGDGLEQLAGPFVTLEVEDNGVGMSRQLVQRVFEPFFTTKPKGRGTGLGLALVYGVVQNHGGHVQVDSEEGKGTTFRIFLPVCGEPAEPTEVAIHAVENTPSGARGLILVADDNQVVRDLTRDVLENHGYQVVCAEDGRRAVELYEEHKGAIDLIILDMVMPEMDGLAAFRAITAKDPTARIVAASGYTQDSWPGHMAAGGVTHFLKKPYSVPELLSAVREVIRRH